MTMQSIVGVFRPCLALIRTPRNSGSRCGDSGSGSGYSAPRSGDSATTESSTTNPTGSSGLHLRACQVPLHHSPELYLLGLGWFSKSSHNIACLLRCKEFLQLSSEFVVLI